MIAKNIASQGVFLFAKNKTTGLGVAGDEANISVSVSKDGAAAAASGGALSNIGGGLYWLTFTQAETNANALGVYASSTTTDVVIDPTVIPTDRGVVPGSAAPGAVGGLPTVDASNHVAGVQSAVNITSDGNAIGMSAAGVIGVVNVVNTCTTNSDMRGTDGANTVAPPSAVDIANQVETTLSAAHGSGSWTTAVGFSTHNAGDVVTAMGTGAFLTAIPWNAAWSAQVQTSCNAALEAIHLNYLFAVNYDPAAKPGHATSLLNELVENDAGVSRFTANALEQAPVGGDGSIANQTTIIGLLNDVQGAGFATGNDSLEVISSRLPDALDSGNLKVSVQAMTAAIQDAIAAALLGLTDGIETGVTPKQALRGILANTTGKSSGLPGGPIKHYAPDGVTERTSTTFDGDNNRTVVVLSL